MIAAPYFHYVLHFDPYPVIAEISCPVLSLIGEKDVQTVPVENSRAIRHALENGKCKIYRVDIVPNVNHLFQECETGAISEYAELEETFNEAVMEQIAQWITEQTE
jgi:pimeloyl-ACP methyl ester carboxylesterase